MINRRKFISMLGAGSSVAAAVLAFPGTVLAWAENAFAATTLADAEAALFPDNPALASEQVKLKAPQIAENGAVVPITVSTDLPDVSNISILVDKNPNPLCASFNLDPSLEPPTWWPSSRPEVKPTRPARKLKSPSVAAAADREQ